MGIAAPRLDTGRADGHAEAAKRGGSADDDGDAAGGTHDAACPRRGGDRAAPRLDDAPGRPLPAGIPGDPGGGGLVPRPLLQPGLRRRGDAPADPPLRLRRRDPVLGHPGRPPRARPGRALRGGRGAAPRSARRPGGVLAPAGGRRSGGDGASRPGLRDGATAARRTAGRDDAAGLLRCALDGGELHDRRPRHAGPRPRAGAGRGRHRPGRRPDRPARHGADRLPRAPARGRRRRRADLRVPCRHPAARRAGLGRHRRARGRCRRERPAGCRRGRRPHPLVADNPSPG